MMSVMNGWSSIRIPVDTAGRETLGLGPQFPGDTGRKAQVSGADGGSAILGPLGTLRNPEPNLGVVCGLHLQRIKREAQTRPPTLLGPHPHLSLCNYLRTILFP